MGEIHQLSQSELTTTIAQKLREMWDAYVRIDEPAHTKCFTPDFRAVHPDGTVHIGAPTAAEIAANHIDDYWLTNLQAWPVGQEGAIATFTAEVEVRKGGAPQRFKFEVGEVWIRQDNTWKSRYYHATLLK
jgi:hypothetical protein